MTPSNASNWAAMGCAMRAGQPSPRQASRRPPCHHRLPGMRKMISRPTKHPSGDEPILRSEIHTVEEAMTADVVTIAPDETVAAAARMMSDGGVSGLPVIDPNGRLMGLITETDLFDLARVPTLVVWGTMPLATLAAGDRPMMLAMSSASAPTPPSARQLGSWRQNTSTGWLLRSRFRAEGNHLEKRCDSCA